MEIVRQGIYTLEHALFLSLDRAPLGEPNRQYRINRGIVDIWQRAHLPFDFFNHLSRLVTRSEGAPVNVFEGGCGIGRALEDLKRGVTVIKEGIISEIQTEQSRVRQWKEGIVGKEFCGFNGKIHTTGLTLSDDHARIASQTPEPHRVNKMVVGPIKAYEPDEAFDFVYDFMGPARYDPQGAIPVYGRILRPNGQAFLRLALEDYASFELQSQLLTINGLSIVAQGWPQMVRKVNGSPDFQQIFVDVLVQKVS